MTLVSLLPLDLKKEIVKYCDVEFTYVLEETELFPISSRSFCFTVMNYSARRGYLNLLKWTRKHGCRPDEMTCSNAALGGHLEILKYLRQKSRDSESGVITERCPW